MSEKMCLEIFAGFGLVGDSRDELVVFVRDMLEEVCWEISVA